ncbi:MAG: chorismate synthase [Thermodesulfobacteriota bacterium]
MLRYLTSGESHGKALVAILEGIPSGITLSEGYINTELKRRPGGYGRGGRMRIERDRAIILSGVRSGKTLGSPIALSIENLDWENWREVMSVDRKVKRGASSKVTRPRPGHADLSGALKYDHDDVRNVLERSSARETAARVAVGAVCKRLLGECGIEVVSWVEEIGGCGIPRDRVKGVRQEDFTSIFEKAELSEVRCPEVVVGDRMKRRIDRAKREGDSLGGIFKVVALGVPPGLGSYVQWDRKLDGRLACALMSIQAIKGVEVGIGFNASSLPGSLVHDEILYKRLKAGGGRQRKWTARRYWPLDYGYYRESNNAGGIEGGMSNGEAIVVRAVMKPIPTLYKPLRSVDMVSKRAFKASVERSDICAVPAAAVIGESVVAFELARAFMEKFGGDSLKEVKRSYRGYLRYLDKRFSEQG